MDVNKTPTYILPISPLLKTDTEYVPLNVDSKEIEPLEISDTIIRIGDPVKMA